MLHSWGTTVGKVRGGRGTGEGERRKGERREEERREGKKRGRESESRTRWAQIERKRIGGHAFHNVIVSQKYLTCEICYTQTLGNSRNNHERNRMISPTESFLP